MLSFESEAIVFGRSPLFYWFVPFVSLVAGLAAGSFSNVCIARMPLDQSILTPRSRCPTCGHPLRLRDNVPLLSYALLRGRCHFCRCPISLQYPLVELTLGALYLLNAFLFARQGFHLLIVDILLFYSLTITIIDYQHRIIPDELSLSLLVVGLGVAPWNSYLLAAPGAKRLGVAFAAALLGGGGMLALAWLAEKTFKKEALGGGDIKLIAAFGALLGWLGLWSSLLFGSLSGALVGVCLMLLGKKKRGDTLPFGPFLCFGALLALYLPVGCLSWVFP